MGIIYAVENKLTGQIYIGQTNRTLQERKLEHLSDARCHYDSSYFHNALHKYGENAFKWSIIDEHEDPTTLNRLERLHIARYESLDRENGYNLRKGGSNGKHSEETRKKISESCKGRTVSNECRKKISMAFKGENHPFYGKKRPKHSLRMRGENNPNHGKGLKGKDNPNYGGHLSEGTKKKISEANKGRKASKEEIKKNRDTKKGKGLFGFTGCCYKEKSYKPWNRVWMAYIKYYQHTTYLGYFNDPLSGEIVYKFVKDEIENI